MAMSQGEFDRYSETFFDQLHRGKDVEVIARGFGEYYHDCLPPDRGAHILDVGCGAGHFLRFLEISGYIHGEGIELSAQQAERARRCVSLPVHVGDVGDFLEQRRGYYQLITLNDVLEHIPKDQTVNFLRTLRRGLGNGGSLVVNVPQAAGLTTAFNRYNDFTHKLVFTEASLRQVLLMADFQEVRFVRERWPLKWTPRHLSYRLVRWAWYRMLRLVYFIEMPGEKVPSTWQVRIVAVAKP
jgi:cyclopropane fatty-acyl-phospholipid synthase-like methyltransferase